MAEPGELKFDVVEQALKGQYVVPVCLSCGKIHLDVRRTVCECDGFIPLVHSGGVNDVAAVDKEAVKLAQDPEYRTRVRLRMGLPEKVSYQVGTITPGGQPGA